MSCIEAFRDTSPSRPRSKHSDFHGTRDSGSSLLHPEDAFYAFSPPHRSGLGRSNSLAAANANGSSGRKRQSKSRNRSSSRRRRRANGVTTGPWKKLLWVKQSYPDNYTDEETFLDDLQRNPRFRPYEFWPLVADSTIIVQHICSVIIFVSCFTGIFQKRLSPQTVVGWATIGTVAGWVLRDYWQSREAIEKARKQKPAMAAPRGEHGEVESSSNDSRSPSIELTPDDTTASLDTSVLLPSRVHSRDQSTSSFGAISAATSPVVTACDVFAHSAFPQASSEPSTWAGTPSLFSPRMQERLTTAKSAILIYCSLLGLSHILKSLTMSTSSDSIWALSSWLMILNVFTFDYGAGPEAKFPASLSTNAALMASTVLASRLPSTTHVFSLTLFSIQVFGLFPVFRRHLRHHSWTGHMWLTIFLVVLASGGLSVIISGGGWMMGIVGVILGCLITLLSTGLASWWLIGLQRYKNEIRGPWDPARPVIRRAWN